MEKGESEERKVRREIERGVQRREIEKRETEGEEGRQGKGQRKVHVRERGQRRQ